METITENEPVESQPPPETTTENKPVEGEQPATDTQPVEAEQTGTEPATEDTQPATEGEPAEGEEPAAAATEEPKQEGEPVDETAEKQPTEIEEPAAEPPPDEEPAPVEPQTTEEAQPVEEVEQQQEEDKPIDRIWDGTIKQEHLDYMELAKDTVDQNRVCEDLKQIIDERKSRAFSTRCEDREMSLLQINYDEENDKLMILMQEAIGLQFDNRCLGDDHGQRKETTIEEDLAAARMLRDLCASCKQAPCTLDKKRVKVEKCKRCGGSTGRTDSQQLEKIISRMEKNLDSLRKHLNDLKRR